jgi:C_GCAxxG_C_C family probable redox protein
MLLAVGEYLVDDLKTECRRMATGFSGGLGDTREELCGGLSGGVMVIGLLHGRTTLDEDDQPAIKLAALYRTRFLEEFGYTKCRGLRENVVKRIGGLGTCGALVERAALILLELLSEAE